MFAILRTLPSLPLPASLRPSLRHASKKAKGSTKNGRDSVGRRLGPKVMDGEYVETGNILVRQRGTRMHPGFDVACGRDHTLYALSNGLAKFVKGRTGNRGGRGGKGRVFVHVVPVPEFRQKSIERWYRQRAARMGYGSDGIKVGLHVPR